MPLNAIFAHLKTKKIYQNYNKKHLNENILRTSISRQNMEENMPYYSTQRIYNIFVCTLLSKGPTPRYF